MTERSRLDLPGVDPATAATIRSHLAALEDARAELRATVHALRERTAALEASEARYRSLFEASPVPLWVYDVATRRFLAVNAAAVAVYGWSREEFLGELTLADVRPLDTLAEFEAHYRRPREGDPRVRFEAGRWRHRTRDGRELWVEVVTHDLDFEGRPARMALVLDVTERVAAERRRSEEAAREAMTRTSQKLEAVGMLAGGIAHDFNNLLTVVVSNASIAREMLPADTPVREELDEILEAARRGAALTRQLLSFGRQQALAPAPLDLHAVAREAGRLLARLVGQEVKLELIERGVPAVVYADAGHLAQVIMNLVVNARDAMPEGGTITVTTTGGVRLKARSWWVSRVARSAAFRISTTSARRGSLVSRSVRRNSVLAPITVSRLLKSCAMPPASCPTASIFCDCRSCSSARRSAAAARFCSRRSRKVACTACLPP